MREPYTQLYVHLVWATWDRLPIPAAEIRRDAYACMQAECTSLKVDVLAIGGMEDHVHLLARIPATISVADLVKQVKGVSSHFVTHKLGYKDSFKWQGGYGAFTLAKADVPHCRDYVLNQEQHHRDRTTDPDNELPDE